MCCSDSFIYTSPLSSIPSSLSTVKRLNLARLRMSRRRLPGENTTLGLRIMTALKSSGLDTPGLPMAIRKLPKSANWTISPLRRCVTIAQITRSSTALMSAEVSVQVSAISSHRSSNTTLRDMTACA